MKPFVNIFFILVFLLLSGQSKAVIRTHIATSERYYENMIGYVYRFTGYIDSWDEDDQTPNDCYGTPRTSYCTIAITVTERSSTRGTAKLNFFIDDIYEFKTIGELAKIFKAKYPLPYPLTGAQLDDGNPVTTYCFNLGYFTNGGYSANSYVPSVECGFAPPVALKCSIEGNTNLEHGELTTNEINGHKASSSLNASCNNDATLIIRAFGEAGNKNITLRPDGSLESALYINDMPGDTGLKVDFKKNITTPINITSELIQKSELQEGEFHGSGIIMMSMD